MAQSVTGTAAVGTTVTITISQGPDPSVTVPDVTGYTEEAACETIANAGLRYSVTYQSSSSVASGRVISYSPTGTQDEGTTITIVVSTGPAASSSSSSSGTSGTSSSSSSSDSTDSSDTETTE